MISPGTPIGRYVVESLLGEGGMGEVYLARDTALDRAVALKLLTARPIIERDEWTARMAREARATAALNHPNLVAVYDVGEHEGAPFIVMELVVGRSMRALVGDDAIPLADRIRWIAQIAEALGAAHAVGLVHRDVKPDNVMVRDDGTAKLLDFGIARRHDGEQDSSAPTSAERLAALTNEGVIIGTLRYMAPEQLWGEPLDGRADQYAWGLTAYELLSGRSAWEVSDPVRLIATMTSSDPQPLTERSPGLPPHVAAVVDRTLQRDKARRFANMGEVAKALLAPALASTEIASGSLVRSTALAPNATSAPESTSPAAPGATSAEIPIGPSASVSTRGTMHEASRGPRYVAFAIAALVLVAAGALVPTLIARREGTNGAATPVTSSTDAPTPSALDLANVVQGPTEPPSRHVCDVQPTEGPFFCVTSRAWCDVNERPIACCSVGLVPNGDGATCTCPVGGVTEEAALRAGCAAAPPGEERAAAIKRVIRKDFTEIRECFNKGMTRNPVLAGRVSVYIEIDPEGRVFRAQLNGSSLPDAEVQSCVVARFRPMRFNPPADGQGVIRYPIMFGDETSPSSSAAAK